MFSWQENTRTVGFTTSTILKGMAQGHYTHPQRTQLLQLHSPCTMKTLAVKQLNRCHPAPLTSTCSFFVSLHLTTRGTPTKVGSFSNLSLFLCQEYFLKRNVLKVPLCCSARQDLSVNYVTLCVHYVCIVSFALRMPRQLGQ